MKSLIRVIGSIAAGIAVMALLHSGKHHAYSAHPANMIFGEAEDENPVERQKWELMRLRDPETGIIPPGIRERELAFAATIPTREGSGAMFKSSSLADYGWQHRGPYNIGGRTRALGIDISGEDTIIAGGATGGMWRSSDRGASWTRTSLPSQLPSVSTLAQDKRPGKTNIWYYGSGELIGGSGSASYAFYLGNGIYKSIDNGRSWKSLPKTAANAPHTFSSVWDMVARVVTDPTNLTQDRVYAAIYGGIYRSTDGGTTWSAVLADNTTMSPITDVTITPSGILYATLSSEGGKKGIWRSVDGTTWTNITPTNWPAKYSRIVPACAPSDEKSVYFIAETPGAGHVGFNFQHDSVWSSLWKYTYVSGDGAGAGGAWENRSANLPSLGGSFGDFNTQTSYDLHIEVKPDNPNIVYIGGTNLYRSNDGFATPSGVWIGGYRDVPIDSTVRLELEYPHHHPDQHTLVFSPSNPSIIYTGSDGGIHRSDDGGAANVSWTSLNNGYFTSQFYSVAIDHATPGDNSVVGGLQDNGTWMSAVAAEGTHWDSVGSGDGSFCAIADGRTSMYVAKQQGKAYRVLLNGNGKLSQYARIDPLGGKNYLFISPYILDPANTNAMYLTAGSELWYNNDVTAIPLSSQQAATVNWNRMAGATVSDTVSISALGVSKESPAHRLYYGTSNGMIYRIDNATTPDAAVVNITPTAFSRKGYINCVAVDPADGNRAVVVFSNYGLQSLYITTDAGATWTPIGGNLEGGTASPGSGPSCRWFAFLHRPNGTIYLVGTSTGLYSTTGLYGSKTVWLQEGASTIGNMVVDMIDVRQSDGYIVAGTHGGGVYSTTIAQLGVENDRLADAAGFELRGNIPNPVSDITKIDYSIGGSGTFPVQLKVFNARGEEVATLVDRPETAGEYSVNFNSRSAGIGLPSGVYYYRLQVGAEARTREMQIVR